MTFEYTLRAIGEVRSAHKERATLPVEGVAATLQLYPEFAPAMDGIARSSHLIVMALMHEADRTVLRARPRKHDPEAPEAGVFATRSPSRPNPVAVTVVPVLAVHDLAIDVERLDFIDGTPLIDLKPYCPGWDSVYAATRAHRTPVHRMDDERLSALLGRDLENHLGAVARAPWAVAFVQAMLVATRKLGLDPRDASVGFTLSQVDAVMDAVMAVSGASFSNGRLRFEPSPGALQLSLTTPQRAVTLQFIENPAEFRLVADTGRREH